MTVKSEAMTMAMDLQIAVTVGEEEATLTILTRARGRPAASPTWSWWGWPAWWSTLCTRPASPPGAATKWAIVSTGRNEWFSSDLDSQCWRVTSCSSTDNDYPGGSPGGGGWFSPGSNNTNRGYRGDTGYYGNDAHCGAGQRRHGTGGGGFWTGAATGGLLGYMFGNSGYEPVSRVFYVINI